MLIGIIAALPVLIPPLRRRARENPGTRWIVSLSAAAVAALLMFVVSITLLVVVSVGVAQFYWRYNMIYEQNVAEADLPNVAPATRELWLRALIPRPLRSDCVTGPQACALADDLLPFMASVLEPGDSVIRLGDMGLLVPVLLVSLLPAVISGWLILRLTRPPAHVRKGLAAP